MNALTDRGLHPGEVHPSYRVLTRWGADVTPSTVVVTLKPLCMNDCRHRAGTGHLTDFDPASFADHCPQLTGTGEAAQVREAGVLVRLLGELEDALARDDVTAILRSHAVLESYSAHAGSTSRVFRVARERVEGFLRSDLDAVRGALARRLGCEPGEFTGAGDHWVVLRTESNELTILASALWGTGKDRVLRAPLAAFLPCMGLVQWHSPVLPGDDGEVVSTFAVLIQDGHDFDEALRAARALAG